MVSIVVLTYNPDPQKLRQTLRAAAAQTGVETEIIISDDGSAHKDFSFLPAFMEQLGCSNYKLIENAQNRGTVHNCHAGVSAATGEYVFLTSPGDILFNETTMQRFYAFAKKEDARLCFGNAVRYCVQEGKAVRTNIYSIPAAPDAYGPGTTLAQQKMAFFGDNFIIGACYFRSRELTLRCLEALLDVSKYMEDTPSTMLALLEGVRIHYYDKNIVFYEDGTGVSTAASEKWKKLLHADLAASLELLYKRYPTDACLQIARNNALQTSRIKRIAWRFLTHPILSLAMLRQRKLRRSKAVFCSRADMERLQKLIND